VAGERVVADLVEGLDVLDGSVGAHLAESGLNSGSHRERFGLGSNEQVLGVRGVLPKRTVDLWGCASRQVFGAAVSHDADNCIVRLFGSAQPDLFAERCGIGKVAGGESLVDNGDRRSAVVISKAEVAALDER
jgi:hypothetical protein